MVKGGDPSRINPAASCPAFLRPKPSPFVAPKSGKQHAERADGAIGPRMGLTRTPGGKPGGSAEKATP